MGCCASQEVTKDPLLDANLKATSSEKTAATAEKRDYVPPVVEPKQNVKDESSKEDAKDAEAPPEKDLLGNNAEAVAEPAGAKVSEVGAAVVATVGQVAGGDGVRTEEIVVEAPVEPDDAKTEAKKAEEVTPEAVPSNQREFTADELLGGALVEKTVEAEKKVDSVEEKVVEKAEAVAPVAPLVPVETAAVVTEVVEAVAEKPKVEEKVEVIAPAAPVVAAVTDVVPEKETVEVEKAEEPSVKSWLGVVQGAAAATSGAAVGAVTTSAGAVVGLVTGGKDEAPHAEEEVTPVVKEEEEPVSVSVVVAEDASKGGDEGVTVVLASRASKEEVAKPEPQVVPEPAGETVEETSFAIPEADQPASGGKSWFGHLKDAAVATTGAAVGVVTSSVGAVTDLVTGDDDDQGKPAKKETEEKPEAEEAPMEEPPKEEADTTTTTTKEPEPQVVPEPAGETVEETSFAIPDADQPASGGKSWFGHLKDAAVATTGAAVGVVTSSVGAVTDLVTGDDDDEDQGKPAKKETEEAAKEGDTVTPTEAADAAVEPVDDVVGEDPDEGAEEGVGDEGVDPPLAAEGGQHPGSQKSKNKNRNRNRNRRRKGSRGGGRS